MKERVEAPGRRVVPGMASRAIHRRQYAEGKQLARTSAPMKDLPLAEDQFGPKRARPHPQSFIIGIAHAVGLGARFRAEKEETLLIHPDALGADAVALLAQLAAEVDEARSGH